MLNLSAYNDWRLLTRDFSSPEVCVDSGFYSLVAAALERRVWLGTIDEQNVLFPNLFMLYVMPVGCGKGLVTDAVLSLLSHHPFIPKLQDGSVNNELLNFHKEIEKKTGKRETLINLGPSSVTFRKLTNKLATSPRVVHVRPPLPKGMRHALYKHNSMAFVLDELKSLVDEDSENAMNFLLTAYNCKDYTRETMTQGDDVIRNCCINIIAGTQPKSFHKLIRREAVDSGFLSRVFVLAASGPRFRMAELPNLDDEQRAARERLLKLVLSLADCFGECAKTAEAIAWNVEWYADRDRAEPNKSPALAEYYARKQQHLAKIAMITRFAEYQTKDANGQYMIDVRHMEHAEKVLLSWERDMHLAFEFAGENKVGNQAPAIKALLKSTKTGLTFDEIFFHMIRDLKRDELVELLNNMIELKIVKTKQTGGETLYTL